MSSYVSAETRTALIAVPPISQLVNKNEEGKWVGPLIDELHRIEQKSGIPFELRVVPFKRAILMTEEGEADFGVFMESPKRDRMSIPVLKLSDAVYVITSLKKNPISSIAQLEGKTIGRIRGGAEIKALSMMKGIKWHYFNNHEDGVRLLKGERVDFLLTADFRVMEAISSSHLSYDDIAKPFPVENRELWLYWSWNSTLDFNLVRDIKNGSPVSLKGFDSKTLFDSFGKKE